MCTMLHHLRFPFSLAISIWLTTLPPSEAEFVQILFRSRTVDSKQSSVIKSVHVTSKIWCAGLCVEDGCKSFLYNVLPRTCQLHSELLDSTVSSADQGTLQYYYAEKESHLTRTTIRKPTPPRILFVSDALNNAIEFGQVILKNRTVGQYSHLNLHPPSQVTAIAYIASQMTILVATASPKRIISNLLDEDTTKVLRDNVKCYGMAIDEGRQLIFMTIRQPRNFVSRMTTDGKDMTTIYRAQTMITGVVVYPQLKTIFTSSYSAIYSVSYNGGKNKLATKLNSVCLALDPVSGFLYYTDKKKLRKMLITVQRSNISNVLSLQEDASSIVYYKDELYIGGIYSHDIIVYRLADRETSGINVARRERTSQLNLLLSLIY